MPEKRDVVAIKGGVIGKSAPIAHCSRSLSGGDQLFRKEKPLFRNIFFWCAVELFPKQTEQIAFTDEQMICDLSNPRDRTEVFIGVAECLGEQRGEGGASFG